VPIPETGILTSGGSAAYHDVKCIVPSFHRRTRKTSGRRIRSVDLGKWYLCEYWVGIAVEQRFRWSEIRLDRLVIAMELFNDFAALYTLACSTAISIALIESDGGGPGTVKGPWSARQCPAGTQRREHLLNGL
jgi:hypothetical protein